MAGVWEKYWVDGWIEVKKQIFIIMGAGVYYKNQGFIMLGQLPF